MLHRVQMQALLVSLNNLQARGSLCWILTSSLPCSPSHCLVSAVCSPMHSRVLMGIAPFKYYRRYICGWCCLVSRNGAFGNGYPFPSKEQLCSAAGHVRYSIFICWKRLSQIMFPSVRQKHRGCGGGNCCQMNRSCADSDVPLAAPVLPSWFGCCPKVSYQCNKKQSPDSRRSY